MARKCSRDGCSNPAREDRGGMQWQKLCDEHNRQRLARRARSLAQPKCRCGGCLPLGKQLCRGCERREEEARTAFIKHAEDLRHYYESGETP